MSEKLAILDAGAQYGKVIDRRVRELRVESDVHPLNISADKLGGYRALIISGGPQSVYSRSALNCDKNIFFLKIPILGICYGMQLLNYIGGGRVRRLKRREDGPCEITVDPTSAIFKDLDPSQEVLMSHGDSVTKLAHGFRACAYSNRLMAAIENPDMGFYGLQFHPEVDLTRCGKRMLQNFLYDIAGFSGNYTAEDRQKRAIEYIRAGAGEKDVLVLVSGGVDSTVLAALLGKALRPERIHAIHIDNGFMRLNESSQVTEALHSVGINLQVIDASEDFYQAQTMLNGKLVGPLCKVTDPEGKRAIIGDQFIRVARKAIKLSGLDSDKVVLAQGTLRPDLIESASHLASGNATAIKTHHNDTQLSRDERKRKNMLEPFQEYHKDEVREEGAKLGLPEIIVLRQPFPGPGLGVRIICADKPFVTEQFDEIDMALQRYKRKKMGVTLLPVQTVGVQGDGRTYSYLVGLSGEREWEKLFKTAREIPKKIHQINRVVYVFGEKIQVQVKDITPTFLGSDTVGQLQVADDIVNQVLREHDLVRSLSQVPVVLFPVNFGMPGNRSIAIRTFITKDFMTGVPAMPGREIPEEAVLSMVEKIMTFVPGISRVVYDLTSKPPGTTEWE